MGVTPTSTLAHYGWAARLLVLDADAQPVVSGKGSIDMIKPLRLALPD